MNIFFKFYLGKNMKKICIIRTFGGKKICINIQNIQNICLYRDSICKSGRYPTTFAHEGITLGLFKFTFIMIRQEKAKRARNNAMSYHFLVSCKNEW